MRRRAFLLGLAGSFACTARPASASDAVDPAASPPAAPLGLDRRSGYRLIKDWDFRTSIRDLDRLRSEFHTRLIYANGTLDHLNDEWSRYRDNDNHVFTPEGLALRANLKGALQPGNIETGMLRSRWTGQYGVYEISMKVPRGRGLWPAFWLNPEDLTWPPEIDVVEIVTDGPLGTRRSYHYLHSKNVKELPCSVSKLGADKAYTPGFDYADGFHVFAVEWTPKFVRHMVDGVLVKDCEFHWIHNDGRDGGPAHVLTCLAVGGHWPGPPQVDSFPANMVVEYIRVWQA